MTNEYYVLTEQVNFIVDIQDFLIFQASENLFEWDNDWTWHISPHVLNSFIMNWATSYYGWFIIAMLSENIFLGIYIFTAQICLNISRKAIHLHSSSKLFQCSGSLVVVRAF